MIAARARDTLAKMPVNIIRELPAKRSMDFTIKSACLAISALLAGGCTTFLPSDGPTRSAIEQSAAQRALPPIQVVDVNEDVTRRLLARHSSTLFSQVFETPPNRMQQIGSGDVLAVSIWEATPATLFGSVDSSDQQGLQPPSHPTTLPPQPVDGEGFITVPFAGRIAAAGKTLPEIAEDIKKRLAGKANQPEALVLLTQNRSSTVAVVGDVTTNTRVQLTEAHERLLDAIAIAAGVHQPVSKTMIQLARGTLMSSMPLESIIEDPRQNVPLQAGDVVTAVYQSLSFTALGSTGKNDEIPFEATGISLAQALARSHGLTDDRSNPRGLFVFRLEPKSAQPESPLAPGATVEDEVPVVYKIDLADPRSLFLIQKFPILDKDVLYVSNAPSTDLQKFLNLVFLVAYPVLAGKQLGL
jgi:polysaccharide biosynthesis/export protein